MDLGRVPDLRAGPYRMGRGAAWLPPRSCLTALSAAQPRRNGTACWANPSVVARSEFTASATFRARADPRRRLHPRRRVRGNRHHQAPRPRRTSRRARPLDRAQPQSRRKEARRPPERPRRRPQPQLRVRVDPDRATVGSGVLGPRALVGARDSPGEKLVRRVRPDVTIWYHQPQALVRAWGGSVHVRGGTRAWHESRTARSAGRTEPPRTGRTTGSRAASFVVELPAGRLRPAGLPVTRAPSGPCWQPPRPPHSTSSSLRPPAHFRNDHLPRPPRHPAPPGRLARHLGRVTEKAGEPLGLVVGERDRGFGMRRTSALAPDTEAHMPALLGVAQVPRHPEGLRAIVLDKRVAREELDDLRPLSRAAPGAETEPFLDLAAAARAGAHDPPSVRRRRDLRKAPGRIGLRWTGARVTFV